MSPPRVVPRYGPEGADAGPVVMPADRLGRPLHDLRISVTDRCNFRCGYCMPREVFGRDHVFLPQRSLLSFEEITQVAAAAVALGVEKLRLTGGEPLLRRDLPRLVAMLAALRGAGPDADHQRHAAGAPGGRAARGRPGPGQCQPGRARSPGVRPA